MLVGILACGHLYRILDQGRQWRGWRAGGAIPPPRILAKYLPPPSVLGSYRRPSRHMFMMCKFLSEVNSLNES